METRSVAVYVVIAVLVVIILGLVVALIVVSCVAVRRLYCKSVKETPVDNRIYDEIDNAKTSTVGVDHNPAYDSVHT